MDEVALTQGVLDPPTLAAWQEDVLGLTRVLEVLTKGGEQERARDFSGDLRTAVQALVAGQVRGVQVRYRWEGQEWLDTLLPGPGGIRLVRASGPVVQLDSGPAAAGSIRVPE